MNNFILCSALFVGVTSAVAQGTVDFSNNRTFVTVADRLVRDYYGNPIVGTNYVAQLYYGATSAESLVPVTTAPARFRVPTTTSPGTWVGGTRTLNGFGSGTTAVMVVRVWDSGPNGNGTWDQAATRSESSPFSYTVPPVGAPANAFYMEGFRGMTIPEPSVIGLAVIGAGVLFMLRCRKIVSAETPKDGL